MSGIKVPNQFRQIQPSPRTQEQNEARLRQASDMYEKQFLREMVKAMRQTVKPAGLLPTSMTENIYRQKLDEEYVESWNRQGGVGLSDLIYQQLHQQMFPNSTGPRPPGPIPISNPAQPLPLPDINHTPYANSGSRLTGAERASLDSTNKPGPDLGPKVMRSGHETGLTDGEET